jgi:serine/threonine protein kinase/WD40 repeat protein
MDLAGKTFHHYQILERVGHGGMAEVYKAYHATLDCFVAVKILHPHLAAQESFLRRFHQEARVIAKLHHPNIMSVQDFGAEADFVYMVMEFIEGPSLQACLEEAVRREEYWSLGDVLQLLRMVGSAIDYAHQRDMVHRDIKPANILLRAGQSSGEEGGYTLAPAGAPPILTDFGLAYLLGEARQSTTGSLTGTPAYMSPEQAIGERGEKASDFYSLGVVLYEMITHRTPFVTDTPSGMIFKHIYEAPPPLREFRPDISKAVEAVVMKSLSKSPSERYPAASALAEAFEKAVKSETPSRPTPYPMTEDITYDTGDVIGEQYKVLQVLGEGGFSRVYKVRGGSGDVLALKVVNDSSMAFDHLRQEFQTLTALNHPSITKVYDIGVLPNHLYYLVLEYVEGYTLQDCIDQRLLTIGKAVELVGDILEALSYLESCGYIHRDIKPSNIVVTPTGVKIIDFNVSKRLEDASRSQIGTPRYMPPEVPVFGWNRTSDVFSAGLVFYEMTTGRFPFADPSAYAAWDIPHPCELNPALPPSLADIILKALARDPNSRFQSAAEMLQAVRSASLKQKERGAEAIRLQAAVPLPSKPKHVRRRWLPGLDRLPPISLNNVAHLRRLGHFGSGPPIALGNLAGGSGLVVATTAGVQIIDPADGSRREIVRAPAGAWIAADVSTQGNILAAIDRSQNLFVYDLPTGQLLSNPFNLPFAPTAIACSDSGRFVAVVDHVDQKTFLLDIDAGRFIAQLPGFPGPVAFSPDENLVAIGARDETIRLWQIDSGEGIARFDVLGDKVTRLAFNSDGQLLITGGQTTRLWRTSGGHQVAQWSLGQGDVTAVAFSPDSQWMALATDVGRLELRDTATGRKLKEWRTGRVSDLTITADETLHVIEGMTDVCSYDVRKGRQIRTLARTPGYLCASLSPDGLYVAAGATDGSVFLWRTREEPSEQQAWLSEKEPIWAVAFDPDGHRLAVAISGRVDLYDIERNQPLWQAWIQRRHGHIAFSSDGRLLVVHQAGATEWLEATTGKRVKRLKADVAAVAPTGQAMAVVHGGKLHLFDLFTRQTTGRCPVPTCRNLALNDTARLLALATLDGAIEIWHIEVGRRLIVWSQVKLGLSGHGDRITSLAFGHDGVLLASSGNDGTVRLWDSSTGSVMKVLTSHLGPVKSASFSSDGRLLCSAGLDGMVHLWGVVC